MAVATPCLQWSHSQSPTALSSKKRSLKDVVFVPRSAFLGTMSSKLCRTRSLDLKTKQRVSHSSIRRACSASFDNSSDEDFSRKIQELALRFQLSGNNNDQNLPDFDLESLDFSDLREESSLMESQWMEIQQLPSDWAASIEMKANSVDLPLSLRMIKRKKKQWQEGFIEAGESAYCSVKKAFSSMVFIVRELHSYTLQMRELLFYEDLQGILARVKREIHASFVWLFQEVFSHTPILMVYLMILLANFTVHSMSISAAVASAVPPPILEERESGSKTFDFDSSAIKTISVSSQSGSKTTSVGGNNGGGSKGTPVASGMDGDGWVNRSVNLHRPIVPDGVSPVTTREEEEVELWNSILDEASRIQGQVRDETVMSDDVMQRFVSPVTANMEGDGDYEEYFKTELLYQTGLAQEPNNVLLLANYAQFLYLVVHDYDRAEEYFKRATGVEPKDAEAHSKYANFLWQVRNDLWAAEETFLEAISADPTNSVYAANYAHFLWNTGGEDTCFPLSSPDDETLDA